MAWPPAAVRSTEEPSAAVRSAAVRSAAEPSEAMTSPSTHASIPASAASDMHWSAVDCPTTATMPTPRFSESSRASHVTSPLRRTHSNTAGTVHEPRSTVAHKPLGMTRDKLAPNPPPVTWLRACRPPSSTPRESSMSRHTRVYRRVGSSSSSPTVRPKSAHCDSREVPEMSRTRRTSE